MLPATINPSADKNVAFYTERYGAIDPGPLIDKVLDPDFFERAIRTHTSWYGLYREGFAERLPGKQVLELGAGDGLNALIMARLGARVTAIEIAEPAVRSMQMTSKRLQLPVNPLLGDFLQMEDLPTFDFIVGKAFLHHLDHETERLFLRRIASLLRPGGEARFQEPAVNSKALDAIRWLIPVPNRPSILNRARFAEWKERDPHPQRDQSAAHYLGAGLECFGSVRVLPYGSIERFRRLFRDRRRSDAFAEWALRFEERHFPEQVRRIFARSQTIVLSQPIG